MSRRGRIALFLAMMTAGGVSLSLYFLSCHTVRCHIQENPDYKKRFRPRVPLHMTGANTPDADGAWRESTGAILSSWADEADKVEAEIKAEAGSARVSCAVVGNSGSLRGSNYGTRIDAHTYVIRMNSPPIRDFPEDAGRRTTHNLMYIDDDRAVRYYGPQTVTLFFLDTLGQNLSKDAGWDKYNARLRSRLDEIIAPTLPDANGKPAEEKKMPIRGLEKLSAVRILHPQFIRYVNRRWFTPENRQWIDYPSSGFKSIIYAMHICDTIDLFGFGDNMTGKWDHFWAHNIATKNASTEPRPSYEVRHRPDFQERFIAELEARGIIGFYRGNTQRILPGMEKSSAP